MSITGALVLGHFLFIVCLLIFAFTVQYTQVSWTTRQKILLILAILGLCLTGYGYTGWSYENITDMRQLERTPQVPVGAVIGGEVNLTGTALAGTTLHTAPETGTEAIFYRHVIQVRDDDSWKTEHSSAQRADFLLGDDTGEVWVRAGSDPAPRFDPPLKHSRREGSRRHLEYRIDPGDELFLFGYAEAQGATYEVGFAPRGNYFPLISASSAVAVRSGRAIESSIVAALGTTALLFAVFFLMLLLRVRHTALFLTLATTTAVTVFCVQGVWMTEADLKAAHQRATDTIAEGQQAINATLDAHRQDPSAPSDGGAEADADGSILPGAAVPSEARRRIQGIRLSMAQTVHRANDALTAFPARLLAARLGLEPLPPVQLPAAERPALATVADPAPVRFGMIYALVALLIGGLGIGVGTVRGLRRIYLARTLSNIPSTAAAGASYGLTKVSGKVQPVPDTEVLYSPVQQEACVYYDHVVERRSDDKWVQVSQATRKTTFQVEDDSGTLHINPADARVVAYPAYVDERGQGSAKRKHTEHVLAVGDDVLVLGRATVDPVTHDRLVVSADEDSAPFIITTFSDRGLQRHEAMGGFLLLTLGMAATVLAGIGLGGGFVALGPELYALVALCSGGYLLGVLGLIYHNDLITLQQRVNRNAANIDVVLKQRFDLLHSLAEVVRVQLSHERDVTEALTALRTARVNTADAPPDSSEVLAGAVALQLLRGHVEAHPTLASDALAGQLMEALTAVENDLSFMRTGYNDAVEIYNRRRLHVPEVLIALTFRFKKAALLPTTSTPTPTNAVA
ncbi:MAG: hypothetical protein FKY71_13830 [Spiribacter salinus]|uniref:RING-type E3 ubiquitin transferase n=1 Tax=Spiribacter salinus TaxID=1335746 RepID=A0A540VQM1_9GAMM|nr:MAG: hypothetical protein FKY71_13830 [Spiribacter salinus]